MKEMTLQEIQRLLGYEVKIVANKPQRQLSEVPVGETFKIGGMEFIVLEHCPDSRQTKVLLKDFWKKSQFDPKTNNYVNSKIRYELNNEFYRSIPLSANDIVRHHVDLTSDDGRDDYGGVCDFVSLLTCDMYRKYVRILDKYRPGGWWWLATPYSTKDNGYEYAVRCVFGNGTLVNDSCDNDFNGVRPFCIFNSSIFVS